MAAFSSGGYCLEVRLSKTKIGECSCEQMWVVSGGTDEGLGRKSLVVA